TIRWVTRELARAERAAVYARIGTCTQEFGTLASWLVDVINVLTGNLDRVGGAMFTRAATGSPHTRGTPGRGKGVRFGRRRSRVRDVPEVYGELPVACLGEEIETPGEGQIRALVTVAGNPVLSTPNGARLDRALASLEFMVSLDIYVNETTRHADVILPGLSPLEQSHYDVLLRQLAIRAVATACSTSCSAPARTATPSGRTRADSASPSSRRTPTASTWARSSRASPRCCAPRRAGSSLPPSPSRPTSSACARRSSVPTA